MPNEFEKQVRQKMEELKLVPSEPVWQKVERQIRKKKDRRRLILWIPFLALLFGGGLWIGINHYYSSRVSYNKNNNGTGKNNNKTPDQNSKTTSTKTIDKESAEHAIINSRPPNEKATDVPETKKINISYSANPVAQSKISEKIKEAKENLAESTKEIPANAEETDLNKTTVNKVVIQSSIEKELNQVVSSFKIIQPADTTNAFLVNKQKIKPVISIPDSVKHDTASIKKSDSKKLAGSKWKYNLVVASGLSGLSRLNLFNLFNGQKSMNARYYSPSNSSTGPGVIYAGPSSIKKALSFSIGGAVQKQLSKRLLFSAGLQYNYYSNSILVGNKIIRDTLMRTYSVSQYFTNRAANYPSDLKQPYHNHYHFISLPLTIDWQMFKKLPLNFHTGFSVQQMIQTNALIFDFGSQAYYHSNKAFNKTQVFTEYGLSYPVPLNKRFLTVGPQFQYGLTRLEKDNSTHHLFSYGLKAQLQLNKK